MKLVDIDKIQWRATSHGTPCIYKEDIDNLEPVKAIPVEKIEAIKEDIKSNIDKEKLTFNGQFDSALNLALQIIERNMKLILSL